MCRCSVRFKAKWVRGTEMVIAPKGDAPRRALIASGQPILGADGKKLGARWSPCGT